MERACDAAWVDAAFHEHRGRQFERELLFSDVVDRMSLVVAYLTAPNAVRAILEHLSLPTRPAQLAAAQGPPQHAWC
ncbi:hypothetical protein [Archangium lansingense]|uniref:Uncharacterized protein n=1 Tax=Archangium lansingense TaxID=2995310 RepID=A0ABT4A7H9_9BACT|nr:hypothetical protein [Archangium lansinium]MCY1077286.1 hypothetical protein [Archangium lansinium]